MTETFSIELPKTMSPTNDASGGELPIDIKSLVNIVVKRFWLIAITATIIFTYVAYSALSQTPVYTAQAQIIVNNSKLNVVSFDELISGGGLTTSALDTEVRVISSPALLRRVVIELDLTSDPEFNPTLRDYKPGLMDRVKGWISGLLSSDDNEGGAPDIPLTPEQHQEMLTKWATGILRGKVRVSRIGTTYLLAVTVTSTSPDTAARLANAVADQYRVDQMEAKLEATQRGTLWLSERVSVMRDELAIKENAVDQFRRDNGLLNAEGTSLTESNIALLQQQKIGLEADLARARARYDNMRNQINSGAGIDSITEVLTSSVISNLKSQRATVQRKVAELQSTFGPRHPDLVEARNENADIERQILAEVDRVAASIEGEVRIAEDRIASINRELGQNRSTLLRDNSALVRLRELERDAEASRTIYDEIINRYKETSEQEDLIEADARILTPATVPNSPSAPRPKIAMVIGLLLGGVIGGLLALIAEIFDSKLSSTTDVERLGVSALTTVPLISSAGFLGFGKKRPAEYLVENPLSAYSEGIRYLRAAIVFSDIDSQAKTVAITSSLPDEGKTSLSLSLGRMSALSGSKTLVIDGDFRRRQLTEAAGINIETGMIEHLFGEGQLDDVVTKDDLTDLDILPLSPDGHTPHDVFGTAAFDRLHAKLRSVYDLILIDTGPLLLMSEARVIAGKADKTILIVRWRRTNRAVVRKSLGLLKTFRADLLGVVLNMVDLERRRQHNEPGTAYRDYKKYYQVEGKKRFRGLGRKKAAAAKPKAARAPTQAQPTPPTQPKREPEAVD